MSSKGVNSEKRQKIQEFKEVYISRIEDRLTYEEYCNFEASLNDLGVTKAQIARAKDQALEERRKSLIREGQNQGPSRGGKKKVAI